MMERLIKRGYPFKTLRFQSRMRPEFSTYLKDLYPDLQDNESIVCQQKPLNFIQKSILFLAHNFSEDRVDKMKTEGSRSKSNEKEAELAVSLALFMISRNVKPTEITILVAYLGQKKIIRQKLKSKQQAFSHLFLNGDIKCETIDMFQGDENKYVIVSLVRSEALGFLNNINRFCVALSRAKCGLYFVGNYQAFTGTNSISDHCDTWTAKKNVWMRFLSKLKEDGCISYTLDVQCAKHPKESHHQLSTAQQMLEFVQKPNQFCQIVCGKAMPCATPDHVCKETCSSLNHGHDKCRYQVKRVLFCGHTKAALCFEPLEKLVCHARVDYQNKKCKHWSKRKCYVDEESLTCTKPCEFVFPNCSHNCLDKCGNGHNHLVCQEKVATEFPDCKHPILKECGQKFADIKCKAKVMVKLTCGHEAEKSCWTDKNGIKCHSPCNALNDCKIHKCKATCGSNHSHSVCNEMIDAKFELCSHATRKVCSKPITWPCNRKIPVNLPCGHDNVRVCSEPLASVSCVAPCGRKRACGHPCLAKCGEKCESTDCKKCLKNFKKKAEKEYERLEKELENVKGTYFFIEDVDKHSSEYLDLKDKVYQSALSIHNWFKPIVKIERITNKKLEKNYAKAKTKCFGKHEAQKFHGTDDNGIIGISKDGFRLPSNPGNILCL